MMNRRSKRSSTVENCLPLTHQPVGAGHPPTSGLGDKQMKLTPSGLEEQQIIMKCNMAPKAIFGQGQGILLQHLVLVHLDIIKFCYIAT